MKSAEERIAKYNAKYDPAVVQTRFTAVEADAKAGFASAANSIVAMEIAVQTVLNTDDIPPLSRPMYYNLGREIWALVNQGLADPALTSYVCGMLVPKYVAMGGVAATIASILLNVFSITCPP